MTLSTGPWWCAPVLAFGWMTTVPAHSFSAPARAWVIAAARFIPGVWAVLMSSSLERTTRTPSSRHRASLRLSMDDLSPTCSRKPQVSGQSIGKEAVRTGAASSRAAAGLAAAGDGLCAAVDYAHDRGLACDGSDAPDCARAYRRRAHRHRRARAARYDLVAAARLPRRRTGHGGPVPLRRRRDGRLDPA